MNKKVKILINGIIKENLIFVLLLGMSHAGYHQLSYQRDEHGTGYQYQRISSNVR